MDAYRAEDGRGDLFAGAHLSNDLQLESLQLVDRLKLALEDDQVAFLVVYEVL